LQIYEHPFRFCGSAAQAGEVTLTGDANVESDLAGYKIHYGAQKRGEAMGILTPHRSYSQWLKTTTNRKDFLSINHATPNPETDRENSKADRQRNKFVERPLDETTVCC
jgi:hypothetical protein